MGIVTLSNLTVRIDGLNILNELSIDFWEGHIHALVGPNGAGKSTLANAIMGLEGYRDIEGDILFKGQSITGKPIDERARLGITLAWQEPARYNGLGVSEFILSGSKEKSTELVETVLSRVGLDPARYRGRSIDKTLSGGERKRIELASILAMDPQIVMMDEPDSGVDIEAVNNIFHVIRDLKEDGKTIILITHSAAVLKRADHAFLMCHGQLMDKGPVEKILPYFEGKCIPCTHKNFPSPEEVPA